MGLVLRYGTLSLHMHWHTCVWIRTFSSDTRFLCSMSVVEESFEYLDAPVERIAGADVPMPYAANLERMAVPQVLFCFYPKFYVVSCTHVLFMILFSTDAFCAKDLHRVALFGWNS